MSIHKLHVGKIMILFPSMSFKQNGAGVHLYPYAGICGGSWAPSGLDAQAMQVIAGPFLTPNTRLLWSASTPATSTSQWCPGHSVWPCPTPSGFCSSEDLHGKMLSAGYPRPFPTHPTAIPGLGFCFSLVPVQERKSLDQWLSTRTSPIPHGVFWKYVDVLIRCHNDGSYITREFHFTSR